MWSLGVYSLYSLLERMFDTAWWMSSSVWRWRGKKLSWCSVICSADQRRGVGTDHVQGLRGFTLPVSWIWRSTDPGWRVGQHQLSFLQTWLFAAVWSLLVCLGVRPKSAAPEGGWASWAGAGNRPSTETYDKVSVGLPLQVLGDCRSDLCRTVNYCIWSKMSSPKDAMT